MGGVAWQAGIAQVCDLWVRGQAVGDQGGGGAHAGQTQFQGFDATVDQIGLERAGDRARDAPPVAQAF